MRREGVVRAHPGAVTRICGDCGGVGSITAMAATSVRGWHARALYLAVMRAHQVAFGESVRDGTAARANLDALTSAITSHPTFFDLVDVSERAKSYRPTLHIWHSKRATQLADAYDAFQSAVGDNRRAVRREI
jgi:hypothetical protein